MSRSNSVAEIVESLSEADRILVAEKIARADRKLEQLRKQDAIILASLARTLTNPRSGDERLQRRLIEKFIKAIVKEELKNGSC